ncbi:hypothetical protein HNQ95_000735 [Aminobacter ciceronei]|uniref:Uncharacterized protein n=1 Tax=Aminobacter ciceronei TaxID=150723 RepID=A0ABR6C0I2_9HYPH|nr:hypothetical protein [Aminobacter ciceronei]MBA9018475.1 hypothetical protein [Aminobacter ciceronei]
MARRIPWASHRTDDGPDQEAAYLPKEDTRTGWCAAPQRAGANYRRWAIDLRKNAIELPWRDRPVDAGFAIDRLARHGDGRWTIEYQGKAIKFTTTKLRRQVSFRKRMLAKAKVLPPQLDPAAYRKWMDWLMQNAIEAAPQTGDASMAEKSWLNDLPELAGWQNEAPPQATS